MKFLDIALLRVCDYLFEVLIAGVFTWILGEGWFLVSGNFFWDQLWQLIESPDLCQLTILKIFSGNFSLFFLHVSVCMFCDVVASIVPICVKTVSCSVDDWSQTIFSKSDSSLMLSLL